MKNSKKKLIDTWCQLSDVDQLSVLSFAEFLLDKNGAVENMVTEPLDIPRPEQESVIAAIKRLSKTYPMINKDKMLNETSALMSQHVIQGRNAIEVIDELEVIFQRYYQMTLKEE